MCEQLDAIERDGPVSVVSVGAATRTQCIDEIGVLVGVAKRESEMRHARYWRSQCMKRRYANAETGRGARVGQVIISTTTSAIRAPLTHITVSLPLAVHSLRRG
jgi:hypothetical protein